MKLSEKHKLQAESIQKLNAKILEKEESVILLKKSLKEVNLSKFLFSSPYFYFFDKIFLQKTEDYNNLLQIRNEKCESELKLFNNTTTTKYTNLVKTFYMEINNCLSSIQQVYIQMREIKPNLNLLTPFFISN
jgi:hypothetical protein